MIIPLTLTLAMQKQATPQDQWDTTVRESLVKDYDRFLSRKTFRYDPLFRVHKDLSKAFEAMVDDRAGHKSALKLLTLALLSGEPDVKRERRLLTRLSTLKAANREELSVIEKYGTTYRTWVDSFADKSQIYRVVDPYLKGSPTKDITSSLLLLKADLMPDILDLKWDVYNRLVEQYSGTDAAKTAREIILKKKHLEPGDMFPDFVSKDSNGEKFQLSKLRGKVVVLEFWANWCPSCQRTIPIMLGVEKEFAGQNVEFVGINSDGAAPTVKELEAKYNITHRNLVDGSPAGPISISYNIMAWPSFIVIGKDGRVVFRSAGIDADGMTKAIKAAAK